jgi:dTDP-4-amino-4,6-dideoxygalactose transaminase
MDALQAAILSVKLNHLQSWNTRRIQIAALYTSLLQNISGLQTPAVRKNTLHTFHIYGVRTQQRNQLKEYLASKDIDTMIHYPKGLPFTEAYQHLQHTAADFPVTYRLQDELLSLPVNPELTDAEVTYVATCIRNYFSR